MAVKTVAELKQRFETGDVPTAQDFIDFLDSFLHAAGGNFPNPLPAVDASALTNVPIPNPLPARDASELYNINPSEWTVHATNASYASANTFVLTGDQRSRFLQTRRLRIQSGASYLYTEVNGITYNAGTDTSTVTTLDSVLVPGISQVAYAMFTPANANGAISARMIGAVAEWLPSATDPASMSVRVGAGKIIKADGTLVSQAAQTLAFVAPAANPRIDRIVVDMLSGVASIVAGTEAATPVAPAIPAGQLPCAQISLLVGQTQLTNADVKDERTGYSQFKGNPAQMEGGVLAPDVIVAQRDSKNGIVNGAMLIMQDGTGLASIAAGRYIVDNFQYQKSGTMVHNASQVLGSASALVPGFVFGRTRLTLATGQASLAAGDYCNIDTFIEGYQWARYKSGPFTLQLLFRGPVAGTYCVAVRNSSADYSYVAEFSYQTSNADQLVTLVVPSPPGGSWNFTNGIGARISVCLAAGSTFQGQTGWQSGNFVGTANQTNSLNTSPGAVYELAMVRIDPGELPMKWHPADFDPALLLQECQRYYEKSYNYSVAPGTANDSSGIEHSLVGDTTMRTYDWGDVRFKVPKRATPTLTPYSTSGAANMVRDVSAGVDRNGSAGDVGENGGSIGLGSSAAVGALVTYHWTASARF